MSGSLLTSLTSAVSGSGAAGGAFTSALSNVAGQYLQGSFRGIPFVVIGTGGQQGRKFAMHVYPFSDNVWAEDTGRAPRRYRIRAMLVGTLATTQLDLLRSAAEARGPGLLLHPTLGAVNAALMPFEWRERDGVTGVVDLDLEFVEIRSYLSSTILTAATAVIAVASLALSQATSGDYSTSATTALAVGSSVNAAAVSVASGWAAQANAGIRSPIALAAAIAELPGDNGRYASGNSGDVDQQAIVTSVLTDLGAAQATVADDVAAIATATGAAAIAAAVLAVTEAVRTSVVDPGAQIALLTPMVACSAPASTTTAPIGAAIATAQTATAALCRRAALISLAQSCADYTATSSTDAQALQAAMAALFDAEILASADAGDSSTYTALTQLRAQVLQDLAERAANLPSLVTVSRNTALPALVLAEQLYADGSRASDLIAIANPVHPAFMPVEFEALSS